MEVKEVMTSPLRDIDSFPFGKHKGKRMQDVPAEYLDWLADLHSLDLQSQFLPRQMIRVEPLIRRDLCPVPLILADVDIRWSLFHKSPPLPRCENPILNHHRVRHAPRWDVPFGRTLRTWPTVAFDAGCNPAENRPVLRPTC